MLVVLVNLDFSWSGDGASLVLGCAVVAIAVVVVVVVGLMLDVCFVQGCGVEPVSLSSSSSLLLQKSR